MDGPNRWTRRDFLKAAGATAAGGFLGVSGSKPIVFAQNVGLGDWKTLSAGLSDFDMARQDSVDPVMSVQLQKLVRLPNTTPTTEVDGRRVPNLHDSELEITPLTQAKSLLGHPIRNTRDPYQDLELALNRLSSKAQSAGSKPLSDLSDAQDVVDIQLGNTEGRVYDGFQLLNYNKGAFVSGHLKGRYKTKRLKNSGRTFISSIDGQPHKIWEITVNHLWLQQDFLSDTFVALVPSEAHPLDEFVIHWRIYSLIQEDLAPSTITNDAFGKILHGLDSTFTEIPSGTLGEITLKYPIVSCMRGVYTWGWGVHPPRVQFIQFTFENSDGSLTPHAVSFLERTSLMSIDTIGDASPDKKMFRVAQAALNGATGQQIARTLSDANSAPRGTFREWIRLGADVRQLPDEAWEVLAQEDGLGRGDFGPYDVVLAYVNNEIYGDNPYVQFGSESKGAVVRDFEQGGTVKVKIINLDRHVHYYRNVDFSVPVTDDMKRAFGNGKFSFNKFNAKPTYGHAKVVEMQWRTGWGYTPHLGVTAQSWTFPREADRAGLRPFTDQFGQTHEGYLYRNVSGYFRFNPPDAIRAGAGALAELIPAGQPLRDDDGQDGVKIGQDTEGYGIAKMPSEPILTHPNQARFSELNFPGFLRNPHPEGGDIIPATPIWGPFLFFHPETGALKGPDGQWWVDQTYVHGRPVSPNASIVVNIEPARSSAQLFYQFDPLFHDNMIFSYHPRSDIVR